MGIECGPGHIARLMNSMRSSVPFVGLWPSWFVETRKVRSKFPAFGFLPPLKSGFPRPRLAQHLPNRSLLVFVVGTRGTSICWRDRFVSVSADICQRLGRRGLILGGDEPPTQTNDRIEWKGFVPLSEVLTSAALIVHHGGIGTAAAAMEYEVPQVVVPRVFSQHSNSRWLETAGVARVLTSDTYTAEASSRTIELLSGDLAVQNRLKALSERIRETRDVDGLCRFLESALPDCTRVTKPAYANRPHSLLRSIWLLAQAHFKLNIPVLIPQCLSFANTLR